MNLFLVPLANTIGPYIGYGLGNEPVAVPYSILLTLLAAIIERPFVVKSGATTNGLAISIRANVLSAMAGVPVALVAVSAMREVGFILILATAIPFSIAIEGWYLERTSRRKGFVVLWKPLIVGNILSGVVLFLVTVIGFYLNDYLVYTRLVADLRAIAGPVNVVIAIVCALIFFRAFIPTKAKNNTPEWNSEMN